jgi:hypothetical protein
LGGSGRWILLEPAAGPLDERFDAAVDALRARGFRALLAHPERSSTPDLVDLLRRLIARGVLVQATAGYFTDPATRPGLMMLARGCGPRTRKRRPLFAGGPPVELAPAFEILAATESVAAHLEWMALAAPRRIVCGQNVVSPFDARAVTSGEHRSPAARFP